MKIENLPDGKIALVENENTATEMRFGDYSLDDVYVVERHRFGDSRDRYVKTVEFILKQDSDLILLEAKPKTSQEYFVETGDKMFASLNKYFSFAAERNTDDKYAEFAPKNIQAICFHVWQGVGGTVFTELHQHLES